MDTVKFINPHEVNNVSSQNLIVIYKYLEKWAKDNKISKEDINIFDKIKLNDEINVQIKKLGLTSLEYLTNPDVWVPLEVYIQSYLLGKKLTKDPDFFFNCGGSAAKYRTFGIWKTIAQATKGVINAYNSLPEVYPDWNRTKHLRLIKPLKYTGFRSMEGILGYKFFPKIKPEDDYASDRHILGLHEVIPQNWPTMPRGDINQTVNQYNPVSLLNGRFFKHLNLNAKYSDDNREIYVTLNNGKEIKLFDLVYLNPENINGNMTYLGGNHTEEIGKNIDSDKVTGYKALETIIIGGEPVCVKDVIFGGPEFIQYVRAKEFVPLRLWDFAIESPLNKLRKTIGLDSKSDKDRIDWETRAKLRDTIFDLEEHKYNLELIVNQRTSELKESNAQLKVEVYERKIAQEEALYQKKIAEQALVTEQKLHKANIEKERAIKKEHIAVEERKKAEIARNEAIKAKEREVKARKAESQALEKIIKKEKEIIKIVGTMAGRVAHEVRNALTGGKLQINSFQNYPSFDDDRLNEFHDKNLFKSYQKVMFTLMSNLETYIKENKISLNDAKDDFIVYLKEIHKMINYIEPAMQIIEDGIEGGLELTNRFRDFANEQKIERGNDQIDVLDLLNNYSRKYNQFFENNSIDYQIQAYQKDFYLTGEKMQINSILENLVTNAINAVESSKNKKIKVSIMDTSKDNEEYIKIDVQDTGIGIKGDEIEDIFIPFNSSNPEPGHGLGLSEVHNWVKKYDGSINVKSELGKGSIFTVYLKK
jgi:signal transduction histidine kinase